LGLADIVGVEHAYIFGSYAERLAGIDGAPPNDVLVVGDPDTAEIYDACWRARRRLPVTPNQLAAAQVADIDAMVRAGRLQRVALDIPKAERFLAQASDGVAEAPPVKSSNVRYSVTYDATRDRNEAVLAAYGLKKTNGAGQNIAVGDVLVVIFANPPTAAAARHCVRMRVARNGIHYRAVGAPLVATRFGVPNVGKVTGANASVDVSVISTVSVQNGWSQGSGHSTGVPRPLSEEPIALVSPVDAGSAGVGCSMKLA
jgi:hypothetical protein